MNTKDIAKIVQSKGRDEDTMLIHMTPGEVKGLQAIALAHGGSLTINPETGLPEAGFLKSLLPMIAGAALVATGVGAPMAALMVGGGSTALGVAKGKSFGDALGSGLMAGLGAYGGASMAAGFGVGAAGQAATKAVGEKAVAEAAKTAATEAAKTGVVAAAPTAGTAVGQTAAALGRTPFANEGLTAFNSAANAGKVAAQANAGLSGFGARFSEAAKMGFTEGGKNYLGSYAPQVAGMGALQGISKAADSTNKSAQFPGLPPDRTAEYIAAYQPQYQRDVVFRGQNAPMEDTSEFQYFRPRASLSDTLRGLTAAQGGEIGMKDGDFVLDARTVSEIGNGSSNAGKEILSRMGGIPVEGAGDGVSDSVRANIGGVQEARVARDEVIIPRNQVQEMGGSQRLYDLMKQAHEARKTADRGEDTGLARGLMPV